MLFVVFVGEFKAIEVVFVRLNAVCDQEAIELSKFVVTSAIEVVIESVFELVEL